MAIVLQAKPIYDQLKQSLKASFEALPKPATLASVIVKSDYSLEVYIAAQEKLASQLGVEYLLIEFDQATSIEQVNDKISDLNRNKNITGIIVNKPFPDGWNENVIFSAIAPDKDIEGVSPYSWGNLFLGNPTFVAPTALSVLEFLKLCEVELYGKEVTIIGFSAIIGKPLAFILASKMATVNITHVATYESERLPSYVKNADILISAVGKPHLVQGKWIKDQAIVIDVGTGQKDGKLTGDVDFIEAEKRASYITPVPGGVGKLTTILLFQNLLKAVRD